MGSLFSRPKIPSPPPPPAPTTVRDEIGGVEQVPIANGDGTFTYVTRRLPLSPEQAARKAEFERIRNDALAEIKRLSTVSLQEDETTKNALDQWQQSQTQSLQQAQQERQLREERELARRGLADSTAAQNIRRQRALDALQSQQNLGRERAALREEIRGEKLGLQQNLFNLASREEGLETTKALEAGYAGQSTANAINLTNQASLRDYYNRQVEAAVNRGPSLFSQVLNTGFGMVTGGLTSGGGFLSSVFRPRFPTR